MSFHEEEAKVLREIIKRIEKLEGAKNEVTENFKSDDGSYGTCSLSLPAGTAHFFDHGVVISNSSEYTYSCTLTYKRVETGLE
jgi:hypothetical protein